MQQSLVVSVINGFMLTVIIKILTIQNYDTWSIFLLTTIGFVPIANLNFLLPSYHPLVSPVCFNARNVISKRLDLIAFVCTYRFDVIVITEIFLDSFILDSHIVPFGYTTSCCDRNQHAGRVLILVCDLSDCCFVSY